MIITKEKMNEMLEMAKPLIKWMNENCHPHCECVVDLTTVRLIEGIATNKTEEFIKGLNLNSVQQWLCGSASLHPNCPTLRFGQLRIAANVVCNFALKFIWSFLCVKEMKCF